MTPRIFIRSEHAADWRELYARTYPAHRLSFNAWLEAVIRAGIAATDDALNPERYALPGAATERTPK